MLWKEIKIHTTYGALEPISNVLQDFNITGIVIREPLQEEGSDKLYDLNKAEYPDTGIYITFYLPKNVETKGKLQNIVKEIKNLKTYDIDLSIFEYSIKDIQEKDWENEWKKYYHSVKVTDRITIVPEWEEYTKQSQEELTIRLDPGMAFGTGTHPSTKLSIEGLEKYVSTGDKVIDVGCGSGVLSIVSAKLGAKSVLSLDLDPLAIKSTSYNAQLNGIENKLTIKNNDLLKGIDKQVNIIVSNILADIIILFPQDAYDTLEDKGIFITSGIIKDKQNLVEQSLQEVGFVIKEVNSIDHWVSIIAEKNN